MIKRLFDIIIAIVGLVLTAPLFLIIAMMIVSESRGGVFYKSRRIGKNKKPFDLIKFRTMHPNSDKSNITIGNRDPRITQTGYWLRKYKLDELPKFINIFRGEMSMVGPRPDVPKYIQYYTQHMPEYFSMKPGITSYSSIYFSNESEIYVNASDPERMYIEETIPKKVELDRKYYDHQNLITDLHIMLKTIRKIFSKDHAKE